MTPPLAFVTHVSENSGFGVRIRRNRHRTRSRLDVPKVRTMFGARGRPHRKGGDLLLAKQP